MLPKDVFLVFTAMVTHAAASCQRNSCELLSLYALQQGQLLSLEFSPQTSKWTTLD